MKQKTFTGEWIPCSERLPEPYKEDEDDEQ